MHDKYIKARDQSEYLPKTEQPCPIAKRTRNVFSQYGSIYAGFEPVLSHKEKSWNHRQFSTNAKINHKIKTSFSLIFILISGESCLYNAIR